jgi:pilus assembly protein Flp/PilA
MIPRVKRFVQDQSGASAVEYGLIAAGILVSIIAVMQGLGAKLNAALGALN